MPSKFQRIQKAAKIVPLDRGKCEEVLRELKVGNCFIKPKCTDAHKNRDGRLEKEEGLTVIVHLLNS